MANFRPTRRGFVAAASALLVPNTLRLHADVKPSETLYHASFGANGMAFADLGSLTASKHLKLVAVAEVDLARAEEVRKRFPNVKVYQDWRELLDKEKNLNSVNVSTPDHMHAPITMRAMQQGLHVYTQKPLTQTIFEARQLAKKATEKNLITQMGIQIHSHGVHRTVVATIQSGVIGKVKAVHSWSGKQWGDRNPKPKRKDHVPSSLNWDLWCGVAQPTDFIAGYYHPAEWRKRIHFGTGTFGDMGCHILDPVFASLDLTAPRHVKSTGDAPNQTSWGLDAEVHFVFPEGKYTTDLFELTWYHGNRRPTAEVAKLIENHQLFDQGSIYIGTKGVLYSPYIADPVLLPGKDFKDHKLQVQPSEDHYLQFVEACRGNGKTSAPFSYAGRLTESVLLGCLATRFPQETLDWDSANLKITNQPAANDFVRKEYRKGWEVTDL